MDFLSSFLSFFFPMGRKKGKNMVFLAFGLGFEFLTQRVPRKSMKYWYHAVLTFLLHGLKLPQNTWGGANNTILEMR